MHFVYVMSYEDKEKMLKLGFNLIKSDIANNIWVFENADVMTFETEDRISGAGIAFILSDMLTF